MNIDSCVIFSRVARIARLALVTGLLTGSAGMAQLPISFTPGNPPPVLGGSVIPFNHGASGDWGRIDSMAISTNGNVVFLDSANSYIYQLAPGASEPTVVVGPGTAASGSNNCSVLESSASGGYWNGGIALDSANNLYVGNRYSGIAEFCRATYSAATNSWNFTPNSAWTPTPSTTTNGTTTALKPQALYIVRGSQPDCSLVPVGPNCTDTFYFSTSTAAEPGIYEMSLNVAAGTWSNLTPIITDMEAMAPSITVDQAGNIYFVENIYPTPVTSRVNGIREIPAGTTGISATGTGSEATQTQLIGNSDNFTSIGGITLDAHGNLYFASAYQPSYSGFVDGVFMIPNEGTPTNPNLNWNDTVMIAPVTAGEAPFVDPRGFLWISTASGSNWAPRGTAAPTCDTTTVQTIDATCLAEEIVIWKPGMDNLASATASGGTPVQITGYAVVATGGTVTLTANNSFTENEVVTFSVANSSDPLYPLNGLSFYVLGTSLSNTEFSVTIPTVTTQPGYLPAGASGATSATASLTSFSTVYYTFNQATTPATGSFVPSSKSFTAVPNPTPGNLPSGATFTSVPGCTVGTTYPAFTATEETLTNPTSDYSWCALYLQVNAQGPGPVGSEVQMLNSSGGVISGSNVYLSGVGQGAAISNLATPAASSIAKGLSEPRQVAADLQGDTYVADAGQKEIEFYAAGATAPTAPTNAFGNGLSAPTGVAVDLAGDLYIGDSGNVYEIPYINGKLQTSKQTKIASGLGNHLNLAADAWGDVLVADQTNKQVVEISNPQSALLQQGLQTLGSNANFTGPSAIATDNSGNVWVADGTNLWEITMPFGGASEVTSKLPAGVTGLAIDPSGSVFVTSASGVLWIPYQVNSTSSGLNVNAAVSVTSGLGSAPIGVALDGSENVYVDYGSGAGAGLSQLSINGAIDFNTFLNQETNPAVPYEADAQLSNLGNMPLTLGAISSDTITQPNTGEFTIIPAQLNSPACSSSASISPGDSCYLGLYLLDTLTPPAGIGQTNATATVASNAANAASGLNIALSAYIVQDFRPATSMTATISPNTTTAGCAGSVYPGCQTITVTVTSGAGTPQGSVILKVPGSGVAQQEQTATLNSSGVATFQLSNLSGGSYNLLATYSGEGTEGSSPNTCSPAASVCFAGSAYASSFKISKATPTFTVGPPGTAGCLSWTATNCAPNPDFVTGYLGAYFVNLATSAWFTASATSALGQPTGSVSFLLASGNPVDPTQPQNPLTSNGTADFSLVNLPLGVYNINANYNGDQNFNSASVTIPAFQVINPSIEITATPSTVSTPAGTPVTATLNLMPLVGFTLDVSLECVSASLPKYSECTFAYPNAGSGTVTVGAKGATPSTVVVTISSNVPVNSGAVVRREPSWLLAGLLGLGLMGVIAGRKRFNRYLTMICLAVMFLGTFMAVTSCTNAGYSTPPAAPKEITPTGTSNVQIISYNPATLQQDSLTTPVFTLPVTIQ